MSIYSRWLAKTKEKQSAAVNPKIVFLISLSSAFRYITLYLLNRIMYVCCLVISSIMCVQ
jgi:hypothetical protein